MNARKIKKSSDLPRQLLQLKTLTLCKVRGLIAFPNANLDINEKIYIDFIRSFKVLNLGILDLPVQVFPH